MSIKTNYEEILTALAVPFPPEQHSHRTIAGRSEDWVEDHFLIQRLNETCIWQWKCVSYMVHATQPNYAVDHRYSLQILCDDVFSAGCRWIEREGEGGDTGRDLANVKKGSASYAKRHACKNWGMALECWGVTHQLVIKNVIQNAKAEANTDSDIKEAFTDIVEGFLEAAVKILCAAFAQDHTSSHPLGVNETIYNSIISLYKVDVEYGRDSPDGKAVMTWAKTNNNREHLKSVAAENWTRWKGMLRKEEMAAVKLAAKRIESYLPEA